MAADFRNSRASARLDAIRALAALAVLLGHSRSLFFTSYYALIRPSKPILAIYFVSSFAHEAVVIFFVLSGFFIGGSIFRDISAGRWSWMRYASQRLTRLYVVIIPGLLLTAAWDRAGFMLFGNRFDLSGSEFEVANPVKVFEHSNLRTFIVNLAFQQGLLGPMFGSNEPLWSLNMEFWYYVLLPLLVVPLIGAGHWMGRILLGCLLILLIRVLPTSITLYFLLFLMGAVVAFWHTRRRVNDTGIPIQSYVVPASMAAFLGVMIAARIKLGGYQVLSDFSVGLAFSVLVFVIMLDLQPASQPFHRIASQFAGFSFTLYVVHLPIMVFLRNGMIVDRRWTPTLALLILALAIVLTVLLYAYLLSRLTEAHTEKIRRFVFGSRDFKI